MEKQVLVQKIVLYSMEQRTGTEKKKFHKNLGYGW